MIRFLLVLSFLFLSSSTRADELALAFLPDEGETADKRVQAKPIVPLTPPAVIDLDGVGTSDKGCTAGKAVFPEPGRYKISVPEGCESVLAKAWGAGGGGNGGTGGFSIGIISFSSGSKIEVIVGGAGKAGPGGKRGEGGIAEKGKGGFNGGGDGGEGGVRPDYSWGSGGGGGGRSEILIDELPEMVAGGGGGGAGSYIMTINGVPHVQLSGAGLPGGGYDVGAYLSSLFSERHYSERDQQMWGGGRPGSYGIGGKAGFLRENSRCAFPSAGTAKDGGTGGFATDGQLCGTTGGGGGGGGFGAGGGGALTDGGGGGGGLAPIFGATFWGGVAKPANTEDPDYASSAGEVEKNGLVVISWPAPSPQPFFERLARYTNQQSPMYMREEIEQRKYAEQRLDAAWNVYISPSARLKMERERAMTKVPGYQSIPTYERIVDPKAVPGYLFPKKNGLQLSAEDLVPGVIEETGVIYSLSPSTIGSVLQQRIAELQERKFEQIGITVYKSRDMARNAPQKWTARIIYRDAPPIHENELSEDQRRNIVRERLRSAREEADELAKSQCDGKPMSLEDTPRELPEREASIVANNIWWSCHGKILRSASDRMKSETLAKYGLTKAEYELLYVEAAEKGWLNKH